MRKFQVFAAVLFGIFVHTTGVAAEACEGAYWSSEIDLDGRDWYQRETAVTNCNHNLNEKIQNLENLCTESNGWLVLDEEAVCSARKCHYYGQPVNAWYCSHQNTATCCPTGKL